MEIENDDNGVIARNDELFDFDVFHQLNLTQLELEKPLEAKCSIVQTTIAPTSPPDNYCTSLTLSGSETAHYGIGGTYTQTGTVNGRRAWTKGGAWHVQYDGQGYCVSYGRGNTAQCVAKTEFTMSYCAADVDLKWSVWNKAIMVDVGICNPDKFCVQTYEK